jgi:hypothetical protein
MDLIGDIMSNNKKANDKRRTSHGDDVDEAECAGSPKPAVYIPGGNKARDAKLEDEARRQVLPPVERKQSQAARPLAASDSAAVVDPQKPRKLYSAFLAPDAAVATAGGRPSCETTTRASCRTASRRRRSDACRTRRCPTICAIRRRF